MGLHKEGIGIIVRTLAISLAIVLVCWFCLPVWLFWVALGVLAVVNLFVMRFFRRPLRVVNIDETTVFAPADGTVVVIEEVEEKEYFKDRRVQVSIFMSIWNVHINWFPMSGVVNYFRHHHGKFFVAWHPKSSEENERTTIVIGNGSREILYRQIAGTVARRIVSYAKEGQACEQNGECGFIKFGSRVDLFLPLGTQIEVKLNQKVTGTQTVIAKFAEADKDFAQQNA